MIDDSKMCRFCKSNFFRIDFPRTFQRMITCGSIECAGQRRKELWKKRMMKLVSEQAEV